MTETATLNVSVTAAKVNAVKVIAATAMEVAATATLTIAAADLSSR